MKRTPDTTKGQGQRRVIACLALVAFVAYRVADAPQAARRRAGRHLIGVLALSTYCVCAAGDAAADAARGLAWASRSSVRIVARGARTVAGVTRVAAFAGAAFVLIALKLTILAAAAAGRALEPIPVRLGRLVAARGALVARLAARGCVACAAIARTAVPVRRPAGRRLAWQTTATIAVIAVTSVAIVIPTVMGSKASFTSGPTPNPRNTALAGTLTLVNSKDGQAVIDASDLRPGAPAQGTLTLTNTGDFSATATVSKDNVVNTPVSPALSAVLTLQIEDITGAPQNVYNGTLSGFSQASLGTFSVSESRTYRITLVYPTATANTALQNARTAVTFGFTGVTL